MSKKMNKKDMTFEEIDVITATKYLETAIGEDGHSINCRKHNDIFIENYADDMLKGRWSECIIDPLRFNIYGQFGDGQNRMKALILAAREQPKIKILFAVQRNVPIEAFNYIDSGMTRSISIRTGINRQHCEVYNSIYNDVKKRRRINPVIVRKMDKNLEHYFPSIIVKGKRAPVVGHAYMKKAILLRMINDPKHIDYITEWYEALVEYAKNKNNICFNSFPPIFKEFITNIFVKEYGSGRRAPSGREAKKDLFVQAMYMFDYNNKNKKNIYHPITNSAFCSECFAKARKLYRRFD